MKTTIKKLEKSEVEISVVLDTAEFEKYEEKALEKIGERLELQGFRKGKAPVAVVKENTSEMELLEEMAERAISDNYPRILEENKIDAIGHPQISITKIGKGADLEFKIVTAVVPEVKLPDYKKIAEKESSKEEFKKEITVSDEEVEKIILDLRKMRAEQSRPPHEHKEGESEEVRPESDSDAGSENKAHAEIPESEYPALDDTFVKSFGDFKSIDDFKDKIRNNMKAEKEIVQKDKMRLSIVEELIKQTEGEIPEVLIQSELEKIMYKLQSDVSGAGIKFEDYLKQINKTEEDLKKEWEPDAEKRAKLQMIIHTISKTENLKPTEEEIEKDLDKILEMYKDADPARARAYVEQMLTNEKVFNFLEGKNK